MDAVHSGAKGSRRLGPGRSWPRSALRVWGLVPRLHVPEESEAVTGDPLPTALGKRLRWSVHEQRHGHPCGRCGRRLWASLPQRKALTVHFL